MREFLKWPVAQTQWISSQEWELVYMFTWKIIEALGLDRESST